jgi:hypothetical protein
VLWEHDGLAGSEIASIVNLLASPESQVRAAVQALGNDPSATRALSTGEASTGF